MGKIGRFISNVNKLKSDYGLKLAFGLIFDSYLKREKAYQNKIKKYLNTHWMNFFLEFEKNWKTDTSIIPAEKVVWVMWWGNQEQIPELVKICYASLEQYHGDYEIRYLSQNNLEDYVQIPENILRKVSEGKMGVASLSDYVRLHLLRDYGGVWIDATVLLTAQMSDELMLYPFMSRKLSDINASTVAAGRWSGYFMATNQKHSFLFSLLAAFYELYWENNNIIITYLLMDYVIDMAYSCFPQVQKLIDATPPNNKQMKSIQKNLNEDFSAELFEQICQDTQLHKLSYKVKITNPNSFYQALLSGVWMKN